MKAVSQLAQQWPGGKKSDGIHGEKHSHTLYASLNTINSDIIANRTVDNSCKQQHNGSQQGVFVNEFADVKLKAPLFPSRPFAAFQKNFRSNRLSVDE